MAKGREMYVPVLDEDTQLELLVVLENRCEQLGIGKSKAKQLVYAPTPMSKIRWSRWLTSIDMMKYLMLHDDSMGF